VFISSLQIWLGLRNSLLVPVVNAIAKIPICYNLLQKWMIIKYIQIVILFHFVKTSSILKIYLSNRTIKVGIGFVFTKARADPLRTNPQPCISLDNPRPHYSCYNLWWSNLESKFSQSFHLLLTIVLSYPWLDILIFMLLLGVRL